MTTLKSPTLGRRPAYNADGAPNRDAREEILRVAALLFADEGYEAVTVRKISLESGVGAPTIYHYFGDKQNLYRAAVLDQQEQSRSILSRELGNVETIEDFHKWLILLVDNAFIRPANEKLQLREVLSPSDDILKTLATNGFQPIYEAVRDKLNSLQAGAGDGVLPVFLFAAAFGFVTVFPMRKYFTNYAPALDQQNLERAERAAFVSFLKLCADEAINNARNNMLQENISELDAARMAIAELRTASTDISKKLAQLEHRLAGLDDS